MTPCPRCKEKREREHDYCNACNEELIKEFQEGG